MKQHRSITASLILSALILEAFTLASCGGTPSDTETTPASSGDTETTAAPETDYLDALEKKDFGGADFVIYAHEAEAFPNLGTGELNGDILNDALYNREKTVSDLYNINIIDKGIADRGVLRNDVQKAVLGGEEPWQLIMTSMADGINSLMPAGMLYDLNSLPTLDLANEWWNQNLRRNLDFSGHVYAATGAISRVYYNTPIVTVFNQKLADNYGCGDLYTTVGNGEWTVDKFAEYMKVGTEDLDGNGKFDADDRFALLLDEEDGKALFVAAGGRLTETDDKGNYYLDLASERNINIIGKLTGIFADRSNSFYIYSLDADSEKMFIESRATFCLLSMGNVVSHFRDMRDDYGIIPLPKLDENQNGYITYANPWFAAGTAVPANCSTPEMTGFVMEALAYVSYRDLVPAIYNVTLKEKLTRDEKSKTMLDLIYSDIYFDLNSIYDFGGSASQLRSAVVGSNKKPFASTWASIKDKSDKALNDIIEAENKIGG